MFDILARCPVFKGIAQDELEKMVSGVRHFRKNYHTNDMIAIAGEPCNYLMCLL